MSIDKRYGKTGASQTQSNFNRFDGEAVAGQTVFNLSFILKNTDVVFLNGSPADPVLDYGGFGTSILTFVNPLNLYDKVLVIG